MGYRRPVHVNTVFTTYQFYLCKTVHIKIPIKATNERLLGRFPDAPQAGEHHCQLSHNILELFIIGRYAVNAGQIHEHLSVFRALPIYRRCAHLRTKLIDDLQHLFFSDGCAFFMLHDEGQIFVGGTFVRYLEMRIKNAGSDFGRNRQFMCMWPVVKRELSHPLVELIN